MQNHKFNLFVSGFILLFGSGTPAVQAQSAAYTPFAVGSSLLQPLRYFSYSPWGGTGQGNPIWWGGKILQQSSRGIGGVGYGGYSPYGNPNFYQINADEHGSPQNPNANPQQVIRYGYPNANQFNHSNSGNYNNGSGNSSSNYGNNQNPYQNQQSNNPTSAFQSSRSGRQNFAANNQSYNQQNGQQNNQGPDPFLTPLGGSNDSGSQISNASSRPGSPHNPTGSNGGSTHPGSMKPGKNAPFANSFIETVNSKYNGDISNAMSDPNTRDMARRLGLTGKSQGQLNFSEERKGAIAHILHDDSLDTDSKMTALKALLH